MTSAAVDRSFDDLRLKSQVESGEPVWVKLSNGGQDLKVVLVRGAEFEASEFVAFVIGDRSEDGETVTYQLGQAMS